VSSLAATALAYESGNTTSVITPSVITVAEAARLPLTPEASHSWGTEKSLHKISAQAIGVRKGQKIQQQRKVRRTINNTRNAVERV
jgi:hypothetical protein